MLMELFLHVLQILIPYPLNKVINLKNKVILQIIKVYIYLNVLLKDIYNNFIQFLHLFSVFLFFLFSKEFFPNKCYYTDQNYFKQYNMNVMMTILRNLSSFLLFLLNCKSENLMYFIFETLQYKRIKIQYITYYTFNNI